MAAQFLLQQIQRFLLFLVLSPGIWTGNTSRGSSNIISGNNWIILSTNTKTIVINFIPLDPCQPFNPLKSMAT